LYYEAEVEPLNKKESIMITCKVETIDRDAAERYLNLDKGNNRPFSRNHLGDLIGRQMRGEWVVNGDTIRFDNAGQLRDGQHRLRMVKQTGKPIEVVVVRDIDPEAFITMDVGRKRSFGDVLFIEKEENHTQLATTTAWIWRYLNRKMYGAHLGSYEQLQMVLHGHPQIRDSISFYKQLDHLPGEPAYAAISTATHYLFSRVDVEAANDFLKKYVTGFNIPESDAIGVLRGQIVKYASDVRKPSGDQIFALICRAWNASRVNQPVKKKWTLPGKKQASPRITGFPKDLFLESQLSFEDNQDDNDDNGGED